MFLLIDPIKIYLAAIPDLGTATLLAMLKKSGFVSKLLPTQAVFIKTLFLDCVDEIYYIIKDLSHDEVENIGFHARIKEATLEDLQNYFQLVYDSVFPMNSIDKFLDFTSKEAMNSLYRKLLRLYGIYSKKTHTSVRFLQIILNLIKANRPKIIGLSIHDYYFNDLIFALVSLIKRELDVPLIMGGATTPHLQKEETNRFLRNHDFDYIVQGQADFALPKLVDHIYNETKPADVENLIYLDGDNVVFNPSQFLLDLDKIAFPDFSDSELDKFPVLESILPIQTSRGCSWGRCAFCNHEAYARNTVSYLSPEKVLEKLLYLEDKYNVDKFVLNDAEVPPWRYAKISNTINNAGYAHHFSLMGYGRLVKGFLNQELVSKIKQAGFQMMQWGLESGSQRVLNLMQKGIRAETAAEILKNFAQEEINNLLFVMIGFPGETKNDANETVEFIDENRKWISRLGISRFKFGNNTPIALDPERWGIKFDSRNNYIPPGDGMNHEEIDRFFNKLAKRYEIDFMGIGKENFKYFGKTHMTRYVSFLLNCYHLLSTQQALGYLEDQEIWECLYPYVSSSFAEFEDGVFRLRPINFGVPPNILNHLPQKKLILKHDEYSLWKGCKGAQSLSGLYNTLKLSGFSLTAEQVNILLRSWIEKGYCLIFEKPWGDILT
jgi:radical SAM superfamily enzyme YgiQ (UPF0313 family)